MVRRVDTSLQSRNKGKHLSVDLGKSEYLSNHMEIGELVIQGWVRKYVSRAKYLKIEVYPVRYIRLNRVSGHLQVWKKVGDSLEDNFESKAIILCEPCNEGKPVTDGPSDYSYKFLLEVEGKSWFLFCHDPEELRHWVTEFRKFQKIGN
jgi:hypothetical protein